jgi:hypothetical protein
MFEEKSRASNQEAVAEKIDATKMHGDALFRQSQDVACS